MIDNEPIGDNIFIPPEPALIAKNERKDPIFKNVIPAIIVGPKDPDSRRKALAEEIMGHPRRWDYQSFFDSVPVVSPKGSEADHTDYSILILPKNSTDDFDLYISRAAHNEIACNYLGYSPSKEEFEAIPKFDAKILKDKQTGQRVLVLDFRRLYQKKDITIDKRDEMILKALKVLDPSYFFIGDGIEFGNFLPYYKELEDGEVIKPLIRINRTR